MSDPVESYRLLQQHLDRQPVGFPAASNETDLRLLEQLFTPDEVQVALHLSFRPAPLAPIAARTAPTFSSEQTERLLEAMVQKGAIAWKQQDGVAHWSLGPLLVGMYEWVEIGGAVPGFRPAARAYMETSEFGRSFLEVRPSQMRTIPIGESLPVEHAVAPYDDIRVLVREAPGPFAVFPCVCRESSKRRGESCQKTSRSETCMAVGDAASVLLRRRVAREVSRDELLELLRLSEKEGLVLQPANAQRPGFICACCGCCCGMLSLQKRLPRPVDFWTSSYQAVAEVEACSSCGDCVSRCQVNALSLAGPDQSIRIDLARCIGCGLCVPSCPSQALRLQAKKTPVVPPADDMALQEQILQNRSKATADRRTRG